MLPSWSTSGGPDALLARLAEPAQRARIAHELEQVGTDGCHGCTVDWRTIEISGVRNPALATWWAARSPTWPRQRAVPESDVYFDLLVEDRLATTMLQHVGHEDNVRAIMHIGRTVAASDGILVGARPHPRAWGTFPRYLARYVRDLGLLGLVDCIHHLTGRPAARLRLDRRGLVRAGYAADLVLFDPDTVRDTATFEEPRQQAKGSTGCGSTVLP